MPSGVWRDVVILLAGFVFSIAAGFIGAYVQRLVTRWRERRPLNQLLNFGSAPLLFVFPQRDEVPEAILPRTSTEDFLAMNNFITGLLNIGWSRKIGVRDVQRLDTNDLENNLVIICSPKSNDFSKRFQDDCFDQLRPGFIFRQDEVGYWYITDDIGGRYYSESFDQERAYLAAGVAERELPSKRFDDMAVITKLTNPWNSKTKVIVVAGIRGIGTWGAAECVKKEWRQIHDQLPEDDKESDFSALVKIEYDNCDIATIQVSRVVKLNGD